MTASDRRTAPDADDAHRRRGGPQGLPDPEPRGARRAAAGLPRQREPPRRSRGRCIDAMPTTTSSTTPTSHRGVHTLAEEATAPTRAPATRSRRSSTPPTATRSIFTKNVTEALNLVANALGSATPAEPPLRLGPGDEIVITEMEHHSNIVPWQLPCAAHRRDAALVRRSPTTAGSTCRPSTSSSTSAPRSSRSCTCPTSWARSTRSRRSSRRGQDVGALVAPSTPRSRRRTCRSTCRRSAPTSSPSPGTRCSARPASACSGAATTCSRSCRRSSAAAR